MKTLAEQLRIEQSQLFEKLIKVSAMKPSEGWLTAIRRADKIVIIACKLRAIQRKLKEINPQPVFERGGIEVKKL